MFFCRIFLNPAFESYSTIEVDPDVHGADWLDLERMRDYYNAHRALAPNGVFVAIELLSERPADGEIIHYEESDGIACGTRRSGSTRCGGSGS